jgi:kynureninase
MLPNVTTAQTAVLTALEYQAPRNRIVMTGLDFPSVRYVYEGLARRLGAEIVVIPSEDGIRVDLNRLLEAIDERTRLVAISHVLFKSAFIVDAAAVCKKAKQVGALVSLDGFHAVGVIPVDVKALGVDFYSGGVLKWLCGGPGGCFLYVAPELSKTLEPAFTGWQAHEAPFAFETPMAYAKGGWRWLNGTPSIPSLFAAAEGPKIVRKAGIERIRAKSLRQTEHLIALAEARGYSVTAPRNPAERGGTVAFGVPHAYEMAQLLLSKDVVVDYRPGAGIRVAPHFYTTDAELDRAVSLIEEGLASGEWQRFAASRATVT